MTRDLITTYEPEHTSRDGRLGAYLRSQLGSAEVSLGHQRLRIKKLEALLADCAEFLEPYSDVVDGSYGEPSPNAAMSLLSQINEEIT
jgi:hypothetical protein